MKPYDIGELVLLSAIWGGSFLFMRTGAHDFGPFALALVRVTVASVILIPLVLRRGAGRELKTHWRGLLLVGALNSAIPFVLFSFAALSITGGLSSIVNAMTPLWTATIAFIWMGQTLRASRVTGLVIGFSGVAYLVWGQASFKAGADQSAFWAMIACLVGTLCYGLAANATRHLLGGASSLVVAAGTQLASTLLLAPPALWLWPRTMPGATAWGSALALGTLCTALTHAMYFGLVRRVGPTNAATVTFLIPLFAVLWGGLLLHEFITHQMTAAGVIVLIGTALALGLAEKTTLHARR